MARLSRRQIARYFADEIIERKPDVVTRLTALLVDMHRERELDLIVRDIEYELSLRGIIVADVTSALPLQEDAEESVRQLLARTTDKVLIREHVDLSLIGGIRIRAAGRELDATVRHKLDLLKSAVI